MTPQEIDRIECAIRHIESSLDVDPWAEEIAVEAMRKQIADFDKNGKRTAESAQNVSDGDLISRKAAIESIRECAEAAHDNHEWDMEQGYLNAIECVEEESSAQPERKKGKWIFLDECSNSGYYCSECNKKVAKEGWSNAVKKIKFCPNCGSDMRGEQDES